MSENGRLGTIEYAELVGRIQSAVTEHVPPGSSVLVVSKGDAALIELPGSAAAHFPQDATGGYAGHHPHDSAAATAQLEELRRRGAEYLVLPETARWWLDFYEDFAAHLAGHGELVVEIPGTCLIFALGRRATDPARPPGFARPRASVDQIRDYLESLVTADAKLAVLEADGGLAPALAPIRAMAVRADDLDRNDAPQSLRRLAFDADYLVIPRAADEWLDEHDGIAEQIEESCPRIADQHYLCRVYELVEPRDEAYGDSR